MSSAVWLYVFLCLSVVVADTAYRMGEKGEEEA
jgi:hypothetical protein